MLIIDEGKQQQQQQQQLNFQQQPQVQPGGFDQQNHFDQPLQHQQQPAVQQQFNQFNQVPIVQQKQPGVSAYCISYIAFELHMNYGICLTLGKLCYSVKLRI